LRISYHPNFVVKGAARRSNVSVVVVVVVVVVDLFRQGGLSSAAIPTYALSPAYLGFTVPFGIDSYQVREAVFRLLLLKSCLR
jgi:hypothetical protein